MCRGKLVNLVGATVGLPAFAEFVCPFFQSVLLFPFIDFARCVGEFARYVGEFARYVDAAGELGDGRGELGGTVGEKSRGKSTRWAN